ncbi:MAG: hypothetical protein KDK39_16265 [Leptospiraceae bacterium]|nr:hypothetical protein [Leptospiraceae bacterium]
MNRSFVSLLCFFLVACFPAEPASESFLDPDSLSGLLINLDAANLKAVNFTYTGAMQTGRCKHEMTELSNGKILITGGVGASGVLNSAEIYDPDTGVFSKLENSLNTARWNHKTALLADNTVLIVAGTNGSYEFTGGLNSTEIFNGTTFTTAGNLNSARTMFQVNRLNSNDILLTGGYNTARRWSLFNGGTWTQDTDQLGTDRYRHTATKLLDGRVLIAGGSDAFSAEIIDATGANVSSIANTMLVKRGAYQTGNQHTASLLSNGNVLFVGGSTDSQAEIWNTATQLFSAAGNYSSQYGHKAIKLNDGTPLIIGGASQNADFSWSYSRDAFSFNVNTNTFHFTGRMNATRIHFSAIKLSSGKVLVSGGCIYSTNTTNYLDSAELYTVPGS